MTRRDSRWRLVVLTLVVVLSGAAVAWWLRPGPAGAQRIRIGYIPFMADVPFFVALEEGFFRQEGIAVEPVRFNDGGEAVSALIAGRVDVLAPIAYSVQWPILEQDPEALRMFLPLYETLRSPVSAMLVKSDSPISSTADLTGKKIGTYTGVPQLLYLKLVIRGLGLDPDKDVTLIQVAESLQTTALESGQFDVLFTVDPYVTVARERVGARVLVPNPRVTYIADPFPFGAAAVSPRFLRESPGDFRRIYRALERAVDRMKEDPLGGRGSLPKYTPITADLAPKTAAYEPFTSGDGPDIAAVQKLADIMFASKILGRRLDAGAAFLAEGHLEP